MRSAPTTWLMRAPAPSSRQVGRRRTGGGQRPRCGKCAVSGRRPGTHLWRRCSWVCCTRRARACARSHVCGEAAAAGHLCGAGNATLVLKDATQEVELGKDVPELSLGLEQVAPGAPRPLYCGCRRQCWRWRCSSRCSCCCLAAAATIGALALLLPAAASGAVPCRWQLCPPPRWPLTAAPACPVSVAGVQALCESRSPIPTTRATGCRLPSSRPNPSWEVRAGSSSTPGLLLATGSCHGPDDHAQHLPGLLDCR